MKKVVIASVASLLLGVGIGYFLKTAPEPSTEKIWFQQLVTERFLNNLRTAEAIRRNDTDDIWKLIEGPIAHEFSELKSKNYNYEWRNEIFEKSHLLSALNIYCAKHPESQLNKLLK